MKIVISGGAGFIGRHTARKARAELDAEVIIVDSLQERVHPNGWPQEIRDEKYTHFKADVREPATWDKIMDGLRPDVVVHLAAYQDYQPDYSTFFESNVTSTALLYEKAQEHKHQLQQVVVASSQATLGEGWYTCDLCGPFAGQPRQLSDMLLGQWEMVCPECGSSRDTHPIATLEEKWKPITPYGVSKMSEELTALTLGEMLDVPTVAYRYAIVQGPGQSPWNAYSGVMRATCLQILADQDVVLFEDGQQVRDFISIHDVVEANLMAIDGIVPDGGYNIGGGRPHTIEEMAVTMQQIAGSKREVLTPGWFRVGDVRHTISDNRKMTEAVPWSPDASKIIEDYTWAPYWDWLTTLDLPAKEIVNGAFDRMKESGVLREARV